MTSKKPVYNKRVFQAGVVGAIATLSLLSGSIVYAEDSNTSSSEGGSLRASFDGARKEVKDIKMELKNNLKGIRASTTESMKEIKGQYREDMEDFRNGSSTATSTREIKRERDEALRILKARTASSTRDLRLEAKLKIAVAYADRMTERLNAAINRIQKMIDRATSRAAKVKAAGGNTVQVELDLAAASSSLQMARNDVTNFKSVMDQVKNSQNPKDGLQLIKDAANLTEKDIRAAHTSLLKAITGLKGMSSAEDHESKNSASSTESNN